jgi:Protein of unknown function (DUF2905)
VDTGAAGRIFLTLGVFLLVIGLLLSVGPKIPWLGRLPGDFSFGGPGWKVYVPLGTSLALSLVLSLILWLLNRK